MTEPDTKTKILDAAQELFADQGFMGTSLRNITAAAGVNLASVNYHFGGKEALAKAVVGRLVEPVNRERLEMLDALEAAPGGATLEEYVRAFLEPAFRFKRAAGKGSHYRLLVHVMTGPDSIRAAVEENFSVVARRFMAAFHRALPTLSEQELWLRWRVFLGSFMAVLMPMPMPTLMGKAPRLAEPEMMEFFVLYSVAGLGAGVERKGAS